MLLPVLRLPAQVVSSTRHCNAAVRSKAQCTANASDLIPKNDSGSQGDDSSSGANDTWESLDTSDIAPRNIWCVASNYKDHAKELDGPPSTSSEAPVISLKPGSSMLDPGKKLVLPPWSASVHHQVELAIILNDNMRPTRAAVALNLTACDVQAKLLQKDWPSTLATSYSHSTPIGTLFSVKGVDLQQLELHVEVNGETRQKGSTSQMMSKVPSVLDYIRKHFPALPGDLVLTGAPASSSTLKPGDKVVARVISDSKVLSSGDWEVVAGDSIKQPATQRIVINTSHGGFRLSELATDAYVRAKGLSWGQHHTNSEPGSHDNEYGGGGDESDDDDDDDDDTGIKIWHVPRDDPDLVRIVEELGNRANGEYCSLKIVEVPAGVRWRIADYDGSEWVAEVHNIWG